MQIDIRQADENDIVTLRELCISTFCNAYERFNTPENMSKYLSEHFSEEKLREELADEDSVFFVAVEGPSIIGYVKIGLDPSKENITAKRPIEILRLYADVNFIGKGVGSALMKEVTSFARENRADAIILGVWQKNHGAIEFYSKCGFEIVTSVKFLFGTDLQDDWLMLKKI